MLEPASPDPDAVLGLVDPGIGTLSPFDAASDAMYELALAFVKRHVRRVVSERGITVDDRTLPAGSAVVLHSTHHGIRWVVAGGRVFDAQGHHVSRARSRHAQIPSRRYIWQGGRGDAVDVAYLLANLCVLLDIHVPRPLAVVGTIHEGSDEIPGGMWMMEGRRQAVADAQIPDLILPAKCGYMPGDHLGVRYWPVFDIAQAIDAMFAVAAYRAAST